MRIVKSIVIIFALLAVFVANDARAQATKEEAIALVNKAIDYVKANGKEAAALEFNNKEGGFVKGELYVFFYNFEGVVLANGSNPKMVGINRKEVKDANGKAYIAEIIEGAKTKGEGWVDYMFANPTTKKIEPKTTYFKKVEGMDLFVACGIYKAN